MEIKNVKGTKDLFGNEIANFQYLNSIMSQICELFSYKEMRPPVLEHTETFVRSVGEGSDVVRKEMYTFLDKGNRSLTMRPEFTAGIVRMIVQNKLYATEVLPIKAYYCGPVFRYERPQLGRYRQFNQFGIECIGGNSLYYDAEVILLGYCILSSIGLDNVTIKINTLGDDESRENYKSALKDYFKDKIDLMCDDCKNRYEINPLRILDCKVNEDQKVVKDAPKMRDYLSQASKNRFEQVLKVLDGLQIKYEIDDNLVRGLDYYSETVFEFHLTSKAGNDYGAIGAGGHYDKLISQFGGPNLSGVGFSFGLERLVSILFDNNEEVRENDAEIFVLPMEEKYNSNAIQLSLSLRINGYSTNVNYENGKLSSSIKKAVRANAKLALIIGENEIESNTIIVKNLVDEKQEEVKLDDLSSYLHSLLRHHHHDSDKCECCYGDDDCENHHDERD